MNRAERRKAKKAGLPVKKEPVVNIKAADVEKIKQDASKDAANKAFLLMLGLPVMILHDMPSGVIFCPFCWKMERNTRWSRWTACFKTFSRKAR